MILLLSIRGDSGINRSRFVHRSPPQSLELIPAVPLKSASACRVPRPGKLEPACLATNDRNGLPAEDRDAKPALVQPRPSPRVSSANRARLTTSLMDSLLTDAY